MPHSYGADLAELGRRGASRRDAPKLSAPKTMASTIKHTIGRYWPNIVSLLPPRLTRASGRCRCLPRDLLACLVLRHDLVPAVEQVAQHEEDDQRPDRHEAGGLSQRSHVADHEDVLVGQRRVDHGLRRRTSRLRSLRDEWRDLDERVVRFVPEGEEVDPAVEERRAAFAALLEHVDHLELTGLERTRVF